jgi:serine/threonine protein kinase
LGDRFEAVYTIGAGQNSDTFVGRDHATLVQPQCLIKRFTPIGNTVMERESAAERFRKDIEHWAIASQHPQVPDLLAYFERGKQQFLVQRYLVGPHLDQALREHLGPFDSDDVAAFLRDVLPILHHLHQNRIIHRDIKPTNFRRPPGQPHWWLVDLGAIKPLTATRIAQPGTLVGSADYAAPEQVRGEATFASDLYSLGVVGLHLLTGLPPFDLFDGVNGCWRWRSIVPDVSPSLAALIDRLVQPALRDRCPNVETVMASLGMTVPPLPDPTPKQSSPQPWQAEKTLDLATDIVDAVVLPSESALVVLTAEGQLQVRSLVHLDALKHTLTSKQPFPSAIAAHPQHSMFVIGTRQGCVERWERRDDQWRSHALVRSDRSITQLRFTPDGTTLIMADDAGRLHQWDMRTNRQKATWLDHAASVTSLAVSHTGRRLASGDSEGGVRIWHLETGEPLRSLSRHAGAITALAWLPDDQTLAIASWDMTVRWRCPLTGGERQAVKADGFYLPVRSLLAHPTQPWLVTGSQDGQLQCWSWSGPSHPVEAIATASAPSSLIALGVGSPPGAPSPQVISVTDTGQVHQWGDPV